MQSDNWSELKGCASWPGKVETQASRSSPVWPDRRPGARPGLVGWPRPALAPPVHLLTVHSAKHRPPVERVTYFSLFFSYRWKVWRATSRLLDRCKSPQSDRICQQWKSEDQNCCDGHRLKNSSVMGLGWKSEVWWAQAEKSKLVWWAQARPPPTVGWLLHSASPSTFGLPSSMTRKALIRKRLVVSF